MKEFRYEEKNSEKVEKNSGLGDEFSKMLKYRQQSSSNFGKMQKRSGFAPSA